MRWFKYCKFLMVCCLVAVFSGCEEDDDYRGYMLSGRWFGNLGMMVDGQPAIGSDLEFIPQDYGGYTQGYGYETDYYLRLAGSGGNCRALLYLDGKRRHYLPAFR